MSESLAARAEWPKVLTEWQGPVLRQKWAMGLGRWGFSNSPLPCLDLRTTKGEYGKECGDWVRVVSGRTTGPPGRSEVGGRAWEEDSDVEWVL